MKFCNEKIISAADMSADFESDPILLDQIYGFSFQAVFTGAPDGVIKLQASNDDKTFNQTPVNWDDIADSSYTVSAAGTYMWNFNGAFYKWVRVVYLFASGTGACDVTYVSKGV